MAKTALFSLTKTSRSPVSDYDVVREQVRLGLKRTARRAEVAYARVVKNWKNRPEFRSSVGVGPKQMRLSLKVTGTPKALFLWDLLDRTGARPHIIRPKRPGYPLRFMWGGPGSYQAKTGALPARFGGPGRTVNGKEVRFMKVRHPGFPPRDFSGAINPDITEDFKREVRNGIRRGRRRLNRR